jgi:hypothetical protein
MGGDVSLGEVVEEGVPGGSSPEPESTLQRRGRSIGREQGQSRWRRHDGERIRFDENVVGPILPLVRFNS